MSLTALCLFYGRPRWFLRTFILNSLQVGTVLHEMAHALGSYHEQNRPDRNEYITLLYQNIVPQQLMNFIIKPYNPFGILSYYNYGSIMHYEDDVRKHLK